MGETAAPSTPPRSAEPSWRTKSSKSLPWLLALLLLCVFVQAGLGGASALGDGSYLDYHVAFVHVFELLPVLIAVLAFLGRDRLVGGVNVALFFMIGAQYGIVSLEGNLRALHVVNAFLVFGITLALLMMRLPGAKSLRP